MKRMEKKLSIRAAAILLTAMLVLTAAVPAMAAESGVQSTVSYDSADRTWKYYENGVFVPTYTGFAQNNNGWWYIKNGTVQFQTTSVIKGTVNGEAAWWYVRGGKVQFVNSVEKNENGWWRIENGKVNFKYTGVAQNRNGWWYLKGGKVQFGKTGIVICSGTWYDIRKGKNVRSGAKIVKYKGKYYYVRKGIVDFSYTGRVKVGGTVYNVSKGIASVPVVSNKMDKKAQSFSSPTKYLILVNRSAHKVGIYKGSRYSWNRVKYWTCTVGKSSTPTITGTYNVGSKGRYFDTGSRGRCWYYTRIHGGYLFHSVIYDRSSSPRHIIDGTLGASVSHGCVRLAVANAKWIYDNIPRNTKIYIY